MTTTIPRPTADLRFPHFMIVSASAGSGKTTALTKRYVQFLLSGRLEHRRPQHLLAITFTNNAAAEMKQRILGMLRSLALGDTNLVADMASLCGERKERIPVLAEEVLEGILDQFSEFQVRTIDSFLTNVLRSSAIDLGFSPTVEVQLSADRVLRETFREFSQTAAADGTKLAVLRQLVELAEEGRTGRTQRFLWDPYAAVSATVAGLYQALAATALPVRVPELSTAGDQQRTAAMKAARELRTLVDASGLTMNAHVRADVEDIEAGRFDGVLGRTIKAEAVNKPKTKAQQSANDTFGDRISEALQRMNLALAELSLLAARRHYVPYALTLSLIADTLAEKKSNENIILLDDINRAIRSYLSQEIVPELYIKLGERIYHYLIDEFQDTSPAQWEALRPLLQNTLSGPGSLFIVGDMKQSIFGFRGADWRVMKTVMETVVFPSAPPELLSLTTNYRSRKQLVEHARAVFHDNVGSSDHAEAAAATGLSAYDLRPDPNDTQDGFAEVRHVTADDAARPEKEQIVEFLRSRQSKGYGWGDMAVLTHANDDVVLFSSALNAAGIPYVSQSSLDIRNRKVIAELIALLRFLDAPVDDASFATFLLGDIMASTETRIGAGDVRRLLRATAEDRNAPALYVQFRDAFRDVWTDRFEALYQHVGFLPLYDLVSAIIGSFDLVSRFPEEEASLVRFLEVVREFESAGSNSIRDFVQEAASESETISWELPRPSGDDAVSLMTIHKAKGLGFPVTVVVLYEWSSTGGRVIFHETEGEVELLRITRELSRRHPMLERLYADDQVRRKADELNKLYVALTRAKDEMLVLVVTRDASKAPAVFLPPSRTPEPPARVAPSRAALPRTERAYIHRTAFPVERRPRLLKDWELRRGELIHRVLSKLMTVEDPASDLSVAISSVPPCDADLDIDEVRQTLIRFLTADAVRALFSGPGQVLTEYDIADGTGRLYRVDRAVIRDDELLVVDFKTGGNELEEEYREQVQGYMNVLGALYPQQRPRGVIAYVDRRSVVEVGS